jgi:hypothetical protein
MNTGIDGGMNRVFAARVPNGSTGLSEGGDMEGLALFSLPRAPGTIPGTVNPPRGPVTSPDEPLMASTAASAPAPATRVASAAPSAPADEGFFSSLARKVGLTGSIAADSTASAHPAPVAPAKPKVVEAKRSESPPRPEASIPKAAKPETKQAAARPPLKPSLSGTSTGEAAAPPAKDGLVAGSAPIVQANSFESRFSAVK